MAQLTLKFSLLVNLLIAGAAFGIIYAWVVTVMWGLDATSPRTAIGAMVSMNDRIQNGFFFVAFVAAPLFMWAAALVCVVQGSSEASVLLVVAGLIYAVGVLVTTAAVNVPMNEALAALPLPRDEASLREVWRLFSERWQRWNLVRAVASGAAFLLSAIAMLRA